MLMPQGAQPPTPTLVPLQPRVSSHPRVILQPRPKASSSGQVGGIAALRLAAANVETRLCAWAAQYGPTLMRLSLGIVYLWFGLLKFLPYQSPIDHLAVTTIEMITFHIAPPLLCLHVLALWECLIGIGLLFGVYRRATLALLFLHLPGTFLPMILLPHVCWFAFPLEPTLIGHYILKNFVLVSGGIVVAGALARRGPVAAV